MSIGLIAIVTVIYFFVAVSEFTAGRCGMALAFLGYAFANVGLMWAIKAG